MWTDEYLRHMERGLVTSLEWPSNRSAINGAHWIVASDRPPEHDRIHKAAARLPVTLEIVNTGLYDGLKVAVRRAFDQTRPLLMATPDSLFSEGSIANLVKVGSQRGVCVASAHVRVHSSFLDEMGQLDQAQMVTHAWKHLHRSWSESGTRTGPSGTWFGGVYWYHLTEKLIAVHHRLPTIFLANFVREDLDFFDRHTIFGVWDNIWPPELLINQQRYRLLGSSDAAFMVEITRHNSNVPELHVINSDEPDSFKGNSSYNAINRQFVSLFRLL